jgi:hypothetical protein
MGPRAATLQLNPAEKGHSTSRSAGRLQGPSESFLDVQRSIPAALFYSAAQHHSSVSFSVSKCMSAAVLLHVSHCAAVWPEAHQTEGRFLPALQRVDMTLTWWTP